MCVCVTDGPVVGGDRCGLLCREKHTLSVYWCYLTGMKSLLTAEVLTVFTHHGIPALVYLLWCEHDL